MLICIVLYTYCIWADICREEFESGDSSTCLSSGGCGDRGGSTNSSNGRSERKGVTKRRLTGVSESDSDAMI